MAHPLSDSLIVPSGRRTEGFAPPLGISHSRRDTTTVQGSHHRVAQRKRSRYVFRCIDDDLSRWTGDGEHIAYQRVWILIHLGVADHRDARGMCTRHHDELVGYLDHRPGHARQRGSQSLGPVHHHNVSTTCGRPHAVTTNC